MSGVEVVLPGQSLVVDPASSGFAHGLAIFETIALRGWRLEFWRAHWGRLLASARALGIPVDSDESEVLAAIEGARARVTRGRGSLKSLCFKRRGGRVLSFTLGGSSAGRGMRACHRLGCVSRQ